MSGSLLRFRVVAYLVGVLLITLTLVGLPLKYLLQQDVVVTTVAPTHGVLFMIYVALCLDLARRARWSLGRTVQVAIAGAIPIYSFIAERSVTKELG
jgi:integral membrane protein